VIAGVGFEPHDLEVMGLASTPDCSIPLSYNSNARTFKDLLFISVMRKSKRKVKKRNLLQNIPNILTILRFVLTLVIVLIIVTGSSLVLAVVLFAVAAFTDYLDGKISRKYHLETEFGRKADIIADRFLWGATALAFLVYYGVNGFLSSLHVVQIFIMMARDLIIMPFGFILFFIGRKVMRPRPINKLVNWIQAIALPALILSLEFEFLIYVSLPLSSLALVIGSIAGFLYIQDWNTARRKKWLDDKES